MDANDRNLDPNDAMTRRRALVVEVMGAGPGRQDVARPIRCAPVMTGSGPASTCRGSGGSPSWWPRSPACSPAWLLHYRRDRWFTWNEMKSMAFLDAWLRAARRQRPTAAVTTVLDHGPVYRLARLREFGPAVTGSERFQRWWRASLEGRSAPSTSSCRSRRRCDPAGARERTGALVPQRRPSRGGERGVPRPLPQGVHPDARGGDGGHARVLRVRSDRRPTRSRTRYRPHWGRSARSSRQETSHR